MKTKKQILIVDSQSDRAVLADMLMEQFDMVCVETMVEAGKVVETDGDDIAAVILAVRLPELNGFELLSWMNQGGWNRGIPVIMIFDEPRPEYIKRAYELGAVEYMVRPLDARTVRHRIAACISLENKNNKVMAEQELLFFEEHSREIWFEYTLAPETFRFSKWSSSYLGFPDEIENKPGDMGHAYTVFGEQDFEELKGKLLQTTPETPTVEALYLLHLHGEKRWCEVIAQAIWSEDEVPGFEGAVGKIEDIHDKVARGWLLISSKE